jgi:hypothetical protein
MKIKIEEALWSNLRTSLFHRKDVESAAVLFGEPLKTPTGVVVAIREAHIVPDAAYAIRRMDQISIDPIVMNRLTRPAQDRGMSVFTIHTHPGASEAWFSQADDVGDARLLPSLQCRIPDVPHGSIVMVGNGDAVARVAGEKYGFEETPLQIVGRTLRFLDGNTGESEAWFERQELALGAWGQSQLRRMRVGIIGLGGIGSLVALQLGHLGIGELVLMDGDLVEPSNVSRIAGATPKDAGVSYKVDVAARYAGSHGLVQRVETHRTFLGPDGIPVLGSCDVVISCVDRQIPRALLNRAAYAFHLPVIDLGTAFRVDTTGRIVGDAGRVVVIGPGRPCLGCWGHLDPAALRIESLSPKEREEEILAGYIDGAVEPQPSVIAFNGMVASAGVIELLRLITGFAGVDSPPQRLAFSFSEGTVRRNQLGGHANCHICGNRSRNSK